MYDADIYGCRDYDAAYQRFLDEQAAMLDHRKHSPFYTAMRTQGTLKNGKLALRASPTGAGLGLFAQRAFNKGDIITTYGGLCLCRFRAHIPIGLYRWDRDVTPASHARRSQTADGHVWDGFYWYVHHL